jgi:hypothetical protein
MGLYYTTMIREIRQDFKRVGSFDLELFLKHYELVYKDKYKLPDLLFYLNLEKILKDENVTSKYFNDLLQKELDAQD